MAELGISIVSKLIEVVGSAMIQEVCSIWGFKSQLDDLKDTFTTVRHVLLDAESKDGELGHEAAEYIRQLKGAVYDVDDLFDEVLTLAELKKRNKGAKFSVKVRDFFSSKKNSLIAAYSISLRVKNIVKKLDGITSNHNTFGLRINSQESQPIRKIRKETGSYVYKVDVIGREVDTDNIVNMLLNSGSSQGVSFVSIVGIGGLGKTALAQLVFNDNQVKSEFPLRLWTCVSDEKTKDFDVKKILTNILESMSSEKFDGFSMDLIQDKLGGLLGGKKFLIVLDDLWTEDRNLWLGLKQFLMVGGTGSRVLVTTRSKRTALVVGDNDDRYKYELKGLSPEDSWRLFETTAFGHESKGTNDINYSELVKIGKQIVEKCSNVPLAIRVLGTLLYGQNESKWRSFRDCDLAKLNNGANEIMSILKLSYDNLESPLKVCFIYCSLFPKDFRIKKEKLIWLWMAQGYIVPFDVGQSLEDAAEEYLSILLRRCFFQEVQMNEFGGIKSFKIHDLIHDLAQKLGGNDVATLNYIPSDLRDDVHHIFHLGSICQGDFFPKRKIRSFVQDGFEFNFRVLNIVKNMNFLRTLDLHKLGLEALPYAIGKLLHLRYLDLSNNIHLRKLPDSITHLYNLQTLDLNWCSDLEELPMDLAKLVNLRHLDIHCCYKLSHMPSGLDKLSYLCVLTDFEVGKARCYDYDRKEYQERLLSELENHEMLGVNLRSEKNHETLLERFEPPFSVQVLLLNCYNGSKLPKNWYAVEGNLATLLPNLVRVILFHCSKLVHLPSLSKLLHLKSLSVDKAGELEYIEDTTHEAAALTFFPSLEYIKLSKMNNLKGWLKKDDLTCNTWQPSFIKLTELEIYHCGKLTSFPNCPKLEMLTSYVVGKGLLMSLGNEEGLIKLKELDTDNLDYLKVLSPESLTKLYISNNEELESFAEHGETLFMNWSPLKSLTIKHCHSLRSLNGGGWEHLTSLEWLELDALPKLVFSGQGWDADNNDDDGMLWRSLYRSLKKLKLAELEIKTLPKGLQYLTSLQELKVSRCNNLERLPEWISCLSSLRTLHIVLCNRLKSLPNNIQHLTSLGSLFVYECPHLGERYRKGGDSWLYVKHIPDVYINRYSTLNTQDGAK